MWYQAVIRWEAVFNLDRGLACYKATGLTQKQVSTLLPFCLPCLLLLLRAGCLICIGVKRLKAELRFCSAQQQTERAIKKCVSECVLSKSTFTPCIYFVNPYIEISRLFASTLSSVVFSTSNRQSHFCLHCMQISWNVWTEIVLVFM